MVSAVGNTVDGAQAAGEIYVYSGPVQAGEFTLLHDPAPAAGDAPRFGMHITQRGNVIAVGAPRKDHKGLQDCGLATTFRASAQNAVLHEHPVPFEKALTGFRVLLVDWMGDATLDLAVESLPILANPEGDEQSANRGRWIWDGAKSGTPQHLPAASGSSDHFPQGVAVGQLFPGGREEIVLGDHAYDRVGESKADDVGRIVIYSSGE